MCQKSTPKICKYYCDFFPVTSKQSCNAKRSHVFQEKEARRMFDKRTSPRQTAHRWQKTHPLQMTRPLKWTHSLPNAAKISREIKCVGRSAVDEEHNCSFVCKKAQHNRAVSYTTHWPHLKHFSYLKSYSLFLSQTPIQTQ